MRVRFSFSSRKTGHIENIKKQRVKFPSVMKEVITISDIILQVMDARFFLEMRNKDLDAMISKMGKKTVYVFNKCDLVNVDEMIAKVPDDMHPYVFVSVTKGQGIKNLRDRIRMEAKRVELEGERARVQVGVVGYPNAGKSSLINRLSRRGVASVSKHAGHTKGMQKIRLCEGILLLDTPGVIPDERYTSEGQKEISIDAILGSRTYSNVRNPDGIVADLMNVLTPKDPENITVEEERAIKAGLRRVNAVEKFYEISSEGNSEVLIDELGKKMNFLKKGGVVDEDRTARLIIRDWQEGRIKI